jgi:hypothetical protein
MNWKHVSLLFVRDYFFHYFCLLTGFLGAMLLFAWLEIKYSNHGSILSPVFGDDFLHSEIDGVSAPLAYGSIILLLAFILFFGLSGRFRVKENENGEISVDVRSMFSHVNITPAGKVIFTQKRGMLIYRRVITISAVFYDTNDEPKLVVKEHSNRLRVIPRYYEEDAPKIPLNVPRKFGSVHTIHQVWMEHNWTKQV